MHKVLCEHPRGGWRVPRRSRFRGPLEDSPRRESTSRRRGGTKWLSENLGPLARWLHAQAGRPWDAVHGELRARISTNNAVQLHIWQHAQQYVVQHVELVDGRPYHVFGTERPFQRNVPVVSYRYPLYVCPETGTLRVTPVTPRKRRRATATAGERPPA
jgi:hypothetical protein